jgi:hypothetical protein
VALGANPRQVLTRIVAHAMVLMGSGVAVGGYLGNLAGEFRLCQRFSGPLVSEIGEHVATM